MKPDLACASSKPYLFHDEGRFVPAINDVEKTEGCYFIIRFKPITTLFEWESDWSQF